MMMAGVGYRHERDTFQRTFGMEFELNIDELADSTNNHQPNY
jgi:hypothetical protein